MRWISVRDQWGGPLEVSHWSIVCELVEPYRADHHDGYTEGSTHTGRHREAVQAGAEEGNTEQYHPYMQPLS